MGVLILKLIVGAVAGLFAWMVMEPGNPGLASPAWDRWEGSLVLLFGALVGLSVGAYDGWSRGGKVHIGRGAALGAVLGGIGASLGHGIGIAITTAIFGPAIFLGTDAVGLLGQIPARMIAFLPIGALLGLAIGGSSLNGRKAIQGATGGAIGAALAGALFDPIGHTLGPTLLRLQGAATGEVGGPSRAITFVLMGALIALFIGLVERWSRKAWIRLHLGRNEGKEWSIDGSETFIGRSEGAQIPLFGDQNIAPVHAVIRKHGDRYILFDGGSPVGTFINGQRVAQADLHPGASIQIGGFLLQFLMKGSASGGTYPQPYVPVPQPNMPLPTGAIPVGSVHPTQQMPTPALNPTVAFPSQPNLSPYGMALVVLDGPLIGKRFAISPQIEIGRESAVVPMAYDTNASRRHANVSLQGAGVLVTDLGSTNGTFVNGQRVTQHLAVPGDVLRVGGTSFRIETA